MIELGIDDGIATIIWNVADRPMNVLNDASIAAFETAIRKVIADPAIKGAIISSSRPEFVVGADLDTLRGISDPQAAMKIAGRLSLLFREIETASKPFVAAIKDRRSAAVTRYVSRAITGLPPITRRPRLDCPR